MTGKTSISTYRDCEIAIETNGNSFYVASIRFHSVQLETPGLSFDTLAQALALAKGIIDLRLKPSD
jgi:hypothetical protein